jgi:hypothetical protein
MPSECEQCGVTSRGAVVRGFDGDTLCIDCAAPGDCSRCGTDTSELEHDGVEHDALDDAIHQARIVQTTLRRLEDSDD